MRKEVTLALALSLTLTFFHILEMAAAKALLRCV